jgi:phosphoserine phosphatase RsbU/P
MEKTASMKRFIEHTVTAKISGAVALLIAGGLFLVVFVIDAVNKNLEMDLGLISQLRSAFVVLAAVSVFLFIRSIVPKHSPNPLRLFGIFFITLLAFFAVYLMLAVASPAGFEAVERQLVPSDYLTILFANAAGIVSGGTVILFLYLISKLIFIKRRRGTKPKFIIFLALLFAASLSTWNLAPLESSTASNVLFFAAIVAGIVNSFKFSWIINLTKREKLYSIGSGFVLFILMIFFNVSLSENGFINQSLLYYSHPLQTFVRIVAIFTTIYFGMSFVVTLFHLPTADAFDRKRIELSSVHNLSRLITRVFNFSDLVQTVTNLTIEVTEAKSAWLEVIRWDGADGTEDRFEVVGHKNIEPSAIDAICGETGGLRKHIIETKKVVVIDEFSSDRRTRSLGEPVKNIGSLIGVPLVSQDAMIGILYAAKHIEFGFDQEEIDLISTFADHVTIAIENSRLIEQSIEQERLQQELMVAQKVQRKLLPQRLPRPDGFDLDAFSSPAFEVGGDYYDIVTLPDDKMGIVVGDVSGKGVSAAFYMAELKGIFQALSRSCESTKEFLIKTNNALYGSIDKSAFISLIYAIVDGRSSVMRLSRAGHCPMIHLHNGKIKFHKPNGIGLGLTGAELFDQVIEENTFPIGSGDICVFYTDGVTEARNSAGDEFGVDRLVTTITRHRDFDAVSLRSVILREIGDFTGSDSFDDDLTIVILKRNSG